MNAKRMITEINATVEELMAEKTSLLDRIKSIDDNITAYRMAVESLELTIAQKTEPVAENVVSKPEKASDRIHYKNTTIIEFGGRKQKLSLWAKEYGINHDALSYRLNAGWSVEDALTKSIRQGKPISKRNLRKVFAYDEHNNVIRQYVGVGDAARDLKMPKNVIEKMLNDISIADQLASRNFYLAYAS